MKWKLKGSAPNLEKLQSGIEKYFYGTKVTLVYREFLHLWEVHNSSGIIKGFRVMEVKGRFRFEAAEKQILFFKLHTETKLPWKIIREAPAQGPFDDYAAWLLEEFDVQVTLEDSIAYLKEFGAWELPELQDLELNKGRILWQACLDCQENKTNYFYMGS